VMCESSLVQASDLGLGAQGAADGDSDTPTNLDEVRAKAEGEFIRKALERNYNNVTETAGQLGVSRVTLYRLMKKYGVNIESGGGTVHGYGLAAAQLERVRNRNIELTVCVDKVAASGGYLMACVANKIIAAPFAIIGSIGVMAQIPNVHRLLKKYDIDVELLTAGEYKRTLTVLGENTDKGREKFISDLQVIHDQFKNFISRFRPQTDIATVATGEVWSGESALQMSLIDQVQTSDEYIVAGCEKADVYRVKYQIKKSLPEKMGLAAEATLERVTDKWLQRANNARYLD